MAMKLNRIKRWLPIRDYLKNKWSIYIHFSNRHVNYYTAWLYTTKEDRNYIQSPDHPDLANSGPPRTMSASQARKQPSVPAATSDHDDESSSAASEEEREGQEKEIEEGRRASKAVKRKRSRRLSSFEVSKIIIDKGIRNRTELLALANVQKADGKTDLAEFVFNRGNRVVEEVIATSWEMENASDVIERSKLTRLELLEKSLEDPSVDQCNGQWLQLPNQILRWNDVSREAFSEAVKDLLEKGRGKFRNILFKGPANTGKTFLLNPLNIVYRSFSNPATSTFARVGAEIAELIFLNDFRWNPQIIHWHNLLLMLEGQPVHLPAPKSYFSKDLEFTRDTPIFCTTKHDLGYVKGGVIDERENRNDGGTLALFSVSTTNSRSRTTIHSILRKVLC